MLNLYTDRSRHNPNEILYNNDAVFEAYTSRLALSEEDHALMQKYDGAVVTGQNAMLGAPIRTRYGDANISNLSTGLKTLLNLRHMPSLAKYKVIDITEAGGNILLDIFEQATEMGIPVILRHADLPEFEGRRIMVDNKDVVDSKLDLTCLIRTGEDAHGRD